MSNIKRVAISPFTAIDCIAEQQQEKPSATLKRLVETFQQQDPVERASLPHVLRRQIAKAEKNGLLITVERQPSEQLFNLIQDTHRLQPAMAYAVVAGITLMSLSLVVDMAQKLSPRKN